MRRRFQSTSLRWVFLLTTFLGACGPSSEEVAPGNSPEASALRKGLAPFHDSIQTLVDTGLLPGAVHLVARGGEILDVTAIGFDDIEDGVPLDSRSIFRLASATKIFVSVAFMTWVEEGRESLLWRHRVEVVGIR